MMLAEVAFGLARPSRRWLLVISALGHALVIALVVWQQMRPHRLHPGPEQAVFVLLPPPPAPSLVCRTWVGGGHMSYCKRYYAVPREPVQLMCSRLSPDLLRALRRWPYRTDPCARWTETAEQATRSVAPERPR